jgi:hypothetical protein
MAAWLVVAGVMALIGEPEASALGGLPPEEAQQRSKVALQRVPHRGIQPQVAVDGHGVVHLIYFSGDPAGGDLFYVRSEKGGEKFSEPLRVNHGPGSAIAVGNIRGGHLALGKNSRIHVAWNGTDKAIVKGPRGESPMLYTRLNDAGTAFERERNVIQSAFGLDGGGSVAADEEGNVYVAWHAPRPGVRGEENRCVWVARSTDEGKTFALEKEAYAEPTGACGCCGMRAFADARGDVYLLYRSAQEVVHRDMYLLVSSDKGGRFQGRKIHEWEGGTCPMSSEAFCRSARGVWAAWETGDQVFFARLDRTTGQWSEPQTPGEGKRQKHPVVAENNQGETILAWTEGMGWNKGGSLAWQVFDKAGKPTSEKGRAPGVPTWSLVAVFARPDGGFTILY